MDPPNSAMAEKALPLASLVLWAVLYMAQPVGVPVLFPGTLDPAIVNPAPPLE
jgi:hypothetical protein